MRNHRVLGPLLLVTAVAAASCGGGGNDAGQGPTTTVPASTTSTAPASTDPAMLAKAEAAVLQAGDFPPGWEAQPPEEGLDLEIAWRDIIGCLGVEPGPPPLGIATSPTFLRDLATQGRATVEYTSEPSAQAVAAGFAGPKFSECAKSAFAEDAKRSAPEGGVPGPIAVAPFDFPLPGVTTSASRITFMVNLEDLQVPITQDLLVFFKAGTMIRMTFLNPGGPFPEDLERALVEKVVGRS